MSTRRPCEHTRRAGLVTNVDPASWPEGTRGRVFESRAVCARQECIDDAIRRVAGNTNGTATFYPDPQRMKSAVSA